MFNSLPHFPGVYLVHMERPVTDGRPAQHYIGWSTDVFARLNEHRKSQGARILAVCNERGISYKIARVWKFKDRSFERQLKNRKNARIICPECNPTARNYPVKRKPGKGKKADKHLMHDGSEVPF